jgi:hypothetical protein
MITYELRQGNETPSAVTVPNGSIRFISGGTNNSISSGSVWDEKDFAIYDLNVEIQNASGDVITSYTYNPFVSGDTLVIQTSPGEVSIDDVEKTLTAAVTDINARKAENSTVEALTEQIRLLTERVQRLENQIQ